MAKIARKMCDFPSFSQKFDRFFLNLKEERPKHLSPKVRLLLSLLFSWNKGAYA